MGLTFLIFTCCSTSRTATSSGVPSKSGVQTMASYLGPWNFIVKGTPDGDTSGEMTLSVNGNALKGIISSGRIQTDIRDIKIVNNILTGTFYFNGMTINMNGTFTGNSYVGKVDASGYSFPMTASKK
jgi:hypothetical protein